MIFIKTDINSRKNNIYNIEKPDTDRLLGNEYVKPQNKKLGFIPTLSSKNKLSIITKSISTDYKTCTIYKTIYNEIGEKINDISFKIKLDKYYLAFSTNNHSKVKAGGLHLKNLAINGMVEDKDKSVYVYGLISEKGKDLNFKNKPLGFYIFKFDKGGNKVWQKTTTIKDKLFNSSMVPIRTIIFASIEDNTINIYNRINGGKNKKTFKHSLNTQNGESIKSINNSTDRSKMVGGFGSVNFEYFLYAFDKLPNFKKKAFDANTIIAIEERSEISSYISSIKLSKNKILFNTIITNDGYWLLESDNKTYYKVLYFNK